MTRSAPHRRDRNGFSLLEVLLATSILVGAIAVLGELTRLGNRNARSARDEITAQLSCETKLNRLVAGIEPLDELTDRPLLDRPGWVYSIASLPLQQPGLKLVEVTVRQDLPVERRPIEFRLSRWIFRPEKRDETATGDRDALGSQAPASPPPTGAMP